jgi:hypothetical protein
MSIKSIFRCGKGYLLSIHIEWVGVHLEEGLDGVIYQEYGLLAERSNGRDGNLLGVLYLYQ